MESCVLQLCQEEVYIRQVKSWVEVFNQSKNYDGTVFCPRYHVFSHGHVQDAVEKLMLSLFDVKYTGCYKVGPVEYYTWRVEEPVKIKIPDHEPNIQLLTELIRKNLVVPNSETKPEDFGLRPCGHSQYLIGRVCAEETLVKSVMDYIGVFNSSKNYYGTAGGNDSIIYCPKYHQFAHSKFSAKVFEAIMTNVFGLKYIGSYTDSPKTHCNGGFNEGPREGFDDDAKFFAWKKDH